MSRFIQGDCVRVMATFPGNAVDFILTDPPYLVGFRDRQGRTIAGDKTDEWLQPACNEMYRVLKKDALMVSFYGWNRVDRFMAAWKNAGFSVVGHLVFTKTYTSKAAYVGYRHECAYILAKGRPALPQKPLPDVLGWKYSGNRHHPTEKPVTSLQPLIESFTHPNAIVLDPFAGSGSTCVAALQSGRRYIGIELLEQYHRAGQQRLAAVQRAMQQGAANDTEAAGTAVRLFRFSLHPGWSGGYRLSGSITGATGRDADLLPEYPGGHTDHLPGQRQHA